MPSNPFEVRIESQPIGYCVFIGAHHCMTVQEKCSAEAWASKFRSVIEILGLPALLEACEIFVEVAESGDVPQPSFIDEARTAIARTRGEA